MNQPLTISAQGDLEIVMKRAFEAPRTLVFDAWTKPELLQQWLGVQDGWRLSVCEVDLRVGGSYRYVWSKDGNPDMGLSGIYREIVVSERIVCTEKYDAAWYPGEALLTNVFEESDGRTMSTLTMRYDSPEARDAVLASPMESGVSNSYAMLDTLLGQLS